jgi:nucleoside phosphorylase
MPSVILVVAATRWELRGVDPSLAVECGVGPVEAGIRTSVALSERRPAAVLHVGIAGARRGCGVDVLDCVIGCEAVYCDGARSDHLPALVPDPALVDAARRALPDARVLPIGTSSRVGGARITQIEAMEGYGVLRAAELARVPAIEVRVISNEVEEPDRTLWRFEEAFDRLADVTRTLVPALRGHGSSAMR